MNIYNQIKKYSSQFEEEILYKKQMLDFLNNHTNPFSRTTKEGHFTGSAFLINSNGTKFLLMHHLKLDKWLQPGGHADGNDDLLIVSIQEAREETGIYEIEPVFENIYDIDIHTIPANSREPEHKHYDVRFLLKAGQDNFVKNSESKALTWIEFSSYNSFKISLENSIKRMIKKYQKIDYIAKPL